MVEYKLFSVYKEKWICISCRQMFKKDVNRKFHESTLAKLKEKVGQNTKYKVNENLSKKEEFSCPKCKRELIHVGVKFEIPAKSDEKAWREIEKDFRK